MSIDDLGLAAERTHLAWRRTALTHLGAGILLVRLVDGTALRVVLAVLVIGAAITAGSVAMATGRRRSVPIAAMASLTAAISMVVGVGAVVA